MKYPYCNNQINPQYSIASPNRPYESRALDGSLKGYFWYYGNTVDLVFNLTGELTLEDGTYFSADEVIKSLLVVCSIYDHRNTCVMQFSNSNIGYPLEFQTILHQDEDSNINSVSGAVIVGITADKSVKLPRGVYTIDLSVSRGYDYSATLFSRSSCTFEVR